MDNKNSQNQFSPWQLILSMIIAWVITFFSMWAARGFSMDFFIMPRFAFVLVISVAGAIVIGPAIFGFLYIGRKKQFTKIIDKFSIRYQCIS